MLLEEVIEGLRVRLLPAGIEIAVVVPLWASGAGDPSLVALGDVRSVRVTPAEVLRCVLRQGAPAYVLVHTHPGGGPPSRADLAVTRRLVAASLVCGVQLQASLVLTDTATFDCIAVQVPSM